MADVKDNPIINYAAASAQSQASSRMAQIDIAKQMDVQEQASRDAQVAATTVGNSQATISSAQESWKAATDSQVAAMQVSLGTDWTNQGSESNYWAQEMRDNAHKAYAALDVVHEGQAKTLMNDPLGFISAQFTLPSDIATQHYYADKYNTAEGALNELTNASNAGAIAAKQMEQRSSQAVSEAKATEALATAAGNVANIQANAAGTKIKGITEINALTTQQADMVFKQHQMQIGDAQLAISQQNAADLHAQRLMQQAQRQDVLDTKAATEADWRTQMDLRNIGAKGMGKAPIDSLQMFQQEYRAQQKNPMYQDMLAYGANVQFNGGVVTGIPVAENAGNAARNYASGGTNLASNPAAGFLAQVWNRQKGLPGAPKDPQALSATVNTIAIAAAKSAMTGIDNSNPQAPNIYAAPIPATILGNAGVAGNKFIADTLAPMVGVNPTMQMPDATLLAKAADYSKGGPANYAAAVAGVTDYYKRAVIVNAATRMYTENGLPEQKGYIAKIDGRNVDMTNPTEVKRALFLQSGAFSLGGTLLGR